MTLPPISSINTGAESEQRITVRLKKYWDFLREDRHFPSEEEINPNDLLDIWDNCFIVKANNSCKKEDYQYKYLGLNIIKASGADLTNCKVNALTAPEASHLATEYERVLAHKIPVIDEGTITLSKEKIIKYRQILLPLGDDGVNITSILGGMSYKTIENKEKSFFSKFGSKK